MGTFFKQDGFDNFTVRLASEQDVGVVQQLLRNTALWLQEKGIMQWEYLLDSEAKVEIKRDILAEHTYLVEDMNGNVVATFNLSPKQNDWDIDLWGKRNDNAYYLHRLAVDRKNHHNQIGKRLLRFIDENVCMKDGYLRLDCIAGNLVLNHYYQAAGYSFVEYINQGTDKFSKYEKLVVSRA